MTPQPRLPHICQKVGMSSFEKLPNRNNFLETKLEAFLPSEAYGKKSCFGSACLGIKVFQGSG